MEVQKRLDYGDILNHPYCHIWSTSLLKFRVQAVGGSVFSVVWNKPGPRGIRQSCKGIKLVRNQIRFDHYSAAYVALMVHMLV